MTTDNDGFVHAMPPKEGGDIGLRVSITQGSRQLELAQLTPLHLNAFFIRLAQRIPTKMVPIRL
jgi:hypothetical protein